VWSGRSGGQVGSGGSGGERHVDSGIHQDFRSVGIRETKNLFCEIEEIPRRKILLADLNPFNSVGKIAGDAVDQRSASRQNAATSDVAADEMILHLRKHALSV
jgi:hypothetical protein